MTKNKHETVNFLRLIYPPNIHFLRNFTNFVLRDPGFFTYHTWYGMQKKVCFIEFYESKYHSIFHQKFVKYFSFYICKCMFI